MVFNGDCDGKGRHSFETAMVFRGLLHTLVAENDMRGRRLTYAAGGD
ncbi:hypothetical protein [uncultured Bacteroides sp.]|nr:hypothetical protein [uncultured Bacteroides sp.]